jgi:hypothetical protein
MTRIYHTRQVVALKRGRGVDGKRLSMCDKMQNESEPEKKEQMDQIIDKLSKIKITNPSNGARAKYEIKNKYISI